MKTNSDRYSSKSTAEAACTHCEGIFEHAKWCATRDPNMAYAYQIVFGCVEVDGWRCVDAAFAGRGVDRERASGQLNAKGRRAEARAHIMRIHAALKSRSSTAAVSTREVGSESGMPLARIDRHE
jgi:hypothetical protein